MKEIFKIKMEKCEFYYKVKATCYDTLPIRNLESDKDLDEMMDYFNSLSWDDNAECVRLNCFILSLETLNCKNVLGQ